MLRITPIKKTPLGVVAPCGPQSFAVAVAARKNSKFRKQVRCYMYGISSYFDHKFVINVGKCCIHGREYGYTVHWKLLKAFFLNEWCCPVAQLFEFRAESLHKFIFVMMVIIRSNNWYKYMYILTPFFFEPKKRGCFLTHPFRLPEPDFSQPSTISMYSVKQINLVDTL